MTINKIRTNDGQEHAINYDALENRPIATSAHQYITLSSLKGKETQEVDLSGYLPNDGCNYLVPVQVLAGSASGMVSVYGSTDIVTDAYSYCFFREKSSSSMLEGGQCQMLSPEL